MKENREVVTLEEQNSIINWINNNKQILHSNLNNNQNYINIKDIENIKSDIETKTVLEYIINIKNKIIEIEGLKNFLSGDDIFKDFIYESPPGTKLHYHVDNAFKIKNEKNSDLDFSKIMIRFNVCIQKPEKGGRPIYSGNLIELVERSYIICRSEIDYHTSEWISGNKSRINISFGFLIDTVYLNKFSNRENVINKDCLFIETWNYKDIDKYKIYENIKNIEPNEKYILKIQKENDNNLLKKFIFNISKYHMKRKNKILDEINNCIEFSFVKSKEKEVITEYNKKIKKTPILSIIIFLKHFNKPLIFTNIDNESYKYKEIPDENNIIISIPKKNDYLIIEKSNVYLNLPLDNNDENNELSYLKINIWELPSNDLKEYINDKDVLMNFSYSDNLSYTNFDNNNETNILSIEDKIMLDLNNRELNNDCSNIVYEKINCYYNLIENILYENNNSNSINKINKYLKKLDLYENILILHLFRNNEIDYLNLLEKFDNDIAKDIYPFFNKDIQLFENNRFKKKKIIEKIISKDVCYWIINESEKLNKWIESPYKNYNTYLNIESLPSVLNYILFVSNFWLLNLKKIFELENSNINMNIKDIFVTKYSKENVHFVKNVDESFIILNIALNDNKDYKGGEILFDNVENENILLQQGDMLIYNGKCLRSNGGISYGEKYVLVVIIDIDV